MIFVYIYDDVFKRDDAEDVPVEDDRIISILKASPTDGLQAAIERYGPLVKAAVIRILGAQHPDIEECISDTFIKLWKRTKANGQPHRNLKSYIAAIARNALSMPIGRAKQVPLQNRLKTRSWN